jgi:hypothetical protein
VISPRWKANGYVVANVEDPSAVTHFTMTFSAAANVDFILGGYVSLASAGEGEFGGKLALVPAIASLGAPDVGYAEMRLAF